MTLQVVGAGLGRTGTHSLKIALEQLLAGGQRLQQTLPVGVFARGAELHARQGAGAAVNGQGVH